MLCERCGVKPATAMIATIVDNEKRVEHICSDCQHEMLMHSELSAGFSDAFTALTGLLKGFSGVSAPADTVCPVCGTSFRRFLDSGKFGCAHCYEAFADRLDPVLHKLHYNTEYKGKIPQDMHLRMTRKEDPGDRLEKLREEKAVAVENENYERAAQLKKEIEALEEKMNAASAKDGDRDE